MRTVVYGDYAAQLGLKEKAKLDESILKALVSTDMKERRELFSYILTTLHEEAVYIPLTYERNRAVFRERVRNVTFNPSQFEVPFEKMSLGE
jgi:nickel transport system substrate-binding protein